MAIGTEISLIIEKVKQVMTKPSAFFEGVKSEEGIGPAFKYLAVIAIVPIIPLFLLVSAGMSEMSEFPFDFFAKASPILMTVIPIFSYVTTLLFSFIFAGVIQLSARLLKGSGNFATTYKATIYAGTPSTLLSWIPVVGFIFGLWSLYLVIKGVSILHEVSMGRAVVIVVFLLLVIVVVAGVTGALFAFGMFSV